MSRIRMNVLATILTGAVITAACGPDPVFAPPPTLFPDVVARVSGDAQTAATGATLANPLVIAVTNDGAAVAGAIVRWSVSVGGGSVNPNIGTTDAAGQASTVWTLGPSAGAQLVEVAIGSVLSTTFGATGNPPSPAAATVSVEDNNFNPPSQALAVGGTITWNWTGQNTHNVTFSSGTITSADLGNGGTFNATFATAGTFAYLCSIHGSSMAGTIIVQ